MDTAVFDDVIETGKTVARLRLAEQLAELACDMEAPETERRAIVPTLLKLATDPVREVRSVLADNLADCEELHPDVLFTIVSDDEDIALPFLAATPALDKARTLAILKVGDVARQLIIAGRKEIAPEAVSLICEEGSHEVCACLLDNTAVHLMAGDYRRVYVRFRDHGDIVEQLLSRADLPLEVRIMQAKKASANVHHLMVDRGWIAAHDAEAIVADAEETTVLRIMKKADERELVRLIGFISKKSLLTPALVLRAAITGELNIVNHFLAFLTSSEIAKVRRSIAAAGSSGIKMLCNKAGLPKDCSIILQAAAEVAREGSARSNIPFGARVVENLATSYSALTIHDRVNLLGITERLGDENTRDLSRQLSSELREAA